MNTSRIPAFSDTTLDGVSIWFAEMSVRELLFHPDDPPDTIVGDNGSSFFRARECEELNRIIDRMFDLYGDDMYEAACAVFLHSAGAMLDA